MRAAGAAFQNPTTPTPGAGFSHKGPVKATTVMIQGSSTGKEAINGALRQPGVASPYSIEKRVADIAGMLQLRAPAKEPPGAISAASTAGFFTGQVQKASSSTFYPKNQLSQDKLRDESNDLKRAADSFKAATVAKMLSAEPSLVR